MMTIIIIVVVVVVVIIIQLNNNTYTIHTNTNTNNKVRADGRAAGGDAAQPSVGGWHYPTLFIPRLEGRDFAVAAPAFVSYYVFYSILSYYSVL